MSSIKYFIYIQKKYMYLRELYRQRI